MFVHLFQYRIKSLLRGKVILFWSLIYPILLSILFFITFGSHIGENSTFEMADVAVVTTDKAFIEGDFLEVISTVEYSENNRMFQVHECDETTAKDMLSKGEVIGIVYLSEDLKIEVTGSGLYQSILKIFTDSYKRNVAIYTDLYTEAPEKAEAVNAVITETRDYLHNVSIAGADADSDINYFYAIIAMTCMFGCFIGVQLGNELEANASPLAARKCMSSAHRLTIIVADMLAAFVLDYVNIMIVTVFVKYVLGINICNEPVPYLLVCAFGSIIGVAIGQFTTIIARGKQGLQIALSLTFSLTSCFLGGLMVSGMEHLVAKHAPIINVINPAALISNAFYCLANYSDYRRVRISIITLGMEAVVLTLCSYLSARRIRHADI